MPPSNVLAVQIYSMRRAAPQASGSTTSPLALQRSEFEDFMNAYRPTLEAPRREEPPPKPPEDTKVDFGRSIKKLIKRPQSSPSVQTKNQRVQRTTPATLTHSERERSVTSESKHTAGSEKKAKRPLSTQPDAVLSPPPQTFVPGPTVSVPLEANLARPEPLPPSPTSKSPKPTKPTKNGSEEVPKVVSVPEVCSLPLPVPLPVPTQNQAKKKVSVQEDKRRSGTEWFPDVHCLIISGNNIGRFLPPRHNPDPILSMRVIPIPERKYHVILEFEESLEDAKPKSASSGLMVVAPEEAIHRPRDQKESFSWIRESHVASTGMLLENVERLTDFPYVIYLVVCGGRHELHQKLNFIRDRPIRQQQLHFLAGYEEAVTISRPPLPTFPEKPTSDRAGFIISLYQVLPGEDGLRFEQNWVVWTGARQIYRTVPPCLGLKRISVHKSVFPMGIVNYALICEFSNILDNLTEACLVIDHLRARCCGFTGIYRIIDAL